MANLFKRASKQGIKERAPAKPEPAARPTWIKWAALPWVMVAVMMLVEVCMQLPLLFLPQDQKGDISLDLTTATHASVAPWTQQLSGTTDAANTVEETADTYVDDEEDVPVDEDGNPIAAEAERDTSLDTPDDPYALSAGGTLPYRGETDSYSITYVGYVDRMTIHSSVLAQKYVLTFLLQDGTFMQATEVHGLFNDDTAVVQAPIQAFTLLVDAKEPTVISSIVIHNRFTLNPYRMLFSGLMAGALFLLIVLRKQIGKEPAYGFLIVVLAAGFFMAIASPTNVGLSWDDETHYELSEKLSYGFNSRVTQSMEDFAIFTWSSSSGENLPHPLNSVQDGYRFAAAQNAKYRENPALDSYQLHWTNNLIGYANQAFGMAAARWLGLPFTWQFAMGRVMNVLTYALLCFFAILKCRRFKLTLAAIALFPTAVFLAGSYSYDPLGTGFCFLGIALTMDAIFDRDRPLSRGRALTILLSFVLGSLIKIVYMPMLLLVLLIPRSKFHSNGQRVWFKSAAVALCVLGLLTMVLAVSTNIVQLQDNRAGGADSQGQIEFLKAHPLRYLSFFFPYIIRHFTIYFLDTLRTAFAYLGGTVPTISTLSLGLTLFACFTDNREELGCTFNWKQRIWVFLVLMMVVGLIFTTMYIAWSDVGSPDFGAVQGRYLLPVLPLLFMLLSPDRVINRLDAKKWHLFFYSTQLLILGYSFMDIILTHMFR